MNLEENRLCTFDDWPENAPIDSQRLAKEGFFATGRYLEVECFSCHTRIVASLVYGNQVEEKHRSVQPQCPFLTNSEASNNIPVSDNESAPMTDSASSSSCQPSESLFIEANRLATFKNWPNPNISPESLAKAGFYYLNRSDEAKCAWCKGVIAKWEKDDNAFNEHQRFFPHCPRVQLGPLIDIASEGIRDLGIEPIRIPKEPKYSSFEARLRTYEKWPIRDIQDPLVLAQAGLYYQNIADQVRCFHCSIGLRSWQKDDDAWFEHAKWFPECQFVRMAMGQKFIETVTKAVSKKTTDSNGSSNNQTPSTPSLTLNEAMCSLPVCQALEIGIDGGTIRNVIQHQLSRTGQAYNTVDELIQAVFDVQHEHMDEQELENGSAESREQEAENFSQANNNDSYYNHYAAESIDLPPAIDSSSDINVNNDDGNSAAAAPQSVTLNNETIESLVKPDQNTKKEECLKEANKNPLMSTETVTLEEENRKLKDARLCKVCLDEEFGVVFLPCGHLVTCVQCAPRVEKCPLCRSDIRGYVRTFLS